MFDHRLRVNVSGDPHTTGRSNLAQAVVQLDWRVSQLAQELSLTEHQIPRVRMIIANAMAQWAAIRRQENAEDRSDVKDRIKALLSREQRERFDALIRAEGQLLF